MADDTTIIQDVLDRLDRIMVSIGDIKGDMYRRSEARADNTEIWDYIHRIQGETALALRDATISFSTKIEDMRANWESRNTDYVTKLEAINGKTVHPLISGTIGTLFGAIALAGMEWLFTHGGK